VEGLPIERKSDIKAWVSVTYGCDNFCTFCIVPYVRGRERSRKPSDIVSEIEELVRSGVVEITLLGQNVNSYKGIEDDGMGTKVPREILFPELLEMINGINGLQRIRFTTSHPKDLSYDLILAIKKLDKVCKQIHLPVQAGSSEILRKMNRGYTKEQYLELVDKIKREVPDVVVSTDIIVGFPGETEEDFKDTLDVVNKARFDSAFTFLYSKRTGTPAAQMENQVSDDIARERFKRLLELQTQVSREQNEPMLGKEFMVLCEGTSKTNPDVLTGRTDGNKVVNFTSSTKNLKGKILRVKITSVQTWSLDGEIINEELLY